MFVYLVGFGIIGLFWHILEPSANLQLILGNYTNVTSALGASIAAGASTAAHAQTKKLDKRHDDLELLVKELHEKIDSMS